MKFQIPQVSQVGQGTTLAQIITPNGQIQTIQIPTQQAPNQQTIQIVQAPTPSSLQQQQQQAHQQQQAQQAQQQAQQQSSPQQQQQSSVGNNNPTTITVTRLLQLLVNQPFFIQLSN